MTESEARKIHFLAVQVHSLLNAANALVGDEERVATLTQIIEDTEGMARELADKLGKGL